MTGISKTLYDYLWRFWYPLLTRITRNEPVVFLNYGYAGDATAPHAPVLNEQDEPNRACIQLYHRVAGAVDVQGLDLLEVSCGHGGGAAYVARYLKPKTLVGVDRNPRAVRLCHARHHVEGLTFSIGNALALEFAENTFDGVINVEASHCYPDALAFFREVHRVLRPGGHFLYADFRDIADRALLDRQLQLSGLEVISCDDISPCVVRGMQLNSERYLKLIESLLPGFLWPLAKRFAGVPGSAIYNELVSGATVYLCYHLRKPGGTKSQPSADDVAAAKI